MQVRNQHPAQLAVLHMDPAGVTAPPAGSLRFDASAAYTSLFLSGRSSSAAFTMDGEVLRTSLRAEVALGAGWSLHTELPVLHTSGGFLDDFIIDWHDLFDLPDQNRTSAPRNEFAVRAERGGLVAWEMQRTSLALGDVPVGVQWNVLPLTGERRVGLGIRGAVELPTGDQSRGFGNGWEAALASTPARARDAGLEFADVTAVGIGAEVPLSDRWSALVQSEVETSTLRALDLEATDDPQWLLWTGVRARVGDDLWLDVALGEDLTSQGPPDFTVWIGLGLRVLAEPPARR
jgi:hypothetical protein